jgi:hypothetical protein
MAGILGSIGKAAGGFVSSTIARLTGAGLTKGADSPLTTSGEAKWGGRDSAKDWRVKLTLPAGSPFAEGANSWFKQGPMAPLRDIQGIVFPLTPTIMIQHQAHYNPMGQTHSNHPFYAYRNSEVQSFGIIGSFPVQNFQDARNWVATLHFLRTVTKMFFGDDTSGYKGNPPPILKLNGYGDHVLNNVPVVVTNFTVELTEGVDYISTTQGSVSRRNAIEQVSGAERVALGLSDPQATVPTSWAPAMSMFNVQLQPVYSRSALKNFNLQDFVKGNQNNITSDKSNEGYGFI